MIALAAIGPQISPATAQHSATARLRAAFDAVAAIHADLSMFESHDPEAPAVLELWAAARGFVVQHRNDGGSATALFVELGHHHICVYLVLPRSEVPRER